MSDRTRPGVDVSRFDASFLMRSDSELQATVSTLSTKAAQAAQCAAEAVAAALADPKSLAGMTPDDAGATVGAAEDAIMAAEQLLSAAETTIAPADAADASAPAAMEEEDRQGDSPEVWFEFITDLGSGGGGVRPVHAHDLKHRRGSELVYKPGAETWMKVSEVRAAGSPPTTASTSPRGRRERGASTESDVAEKAKAAAALSKGLSSKIGSRLKAQGSGMLNRGQSTTEAGAGASGGDSGMTISRPFNVSKWKPSFGQPLENCETCPIHGFAVPRVLESLSQALRRRRGLREEGIFRLAPDASECAAAKSNLNMNPTAVDDSLDVHVLANLIKVFFRELPIKILSSISQDEIAQCTTGAECMQVLQGFPLQRKGLVLWLLELMADVAEEQEHNKMNERAIAIVIAPNLYEPDKSANPMEGVVFTQKMTKFLSELLFHYVHVRQSVRRRESNSVRDSKRDTTRSGDATPRAVGAAADAAFVRTGFSMTPQNATRMAKMLSEGRLDDTPEQPAPSEGQQEDAAAELGAEGSRTDAPEAKMERSTSFQTGQIQVMGADL